MIDLDKFCGATDGRTYLAKPFAIGEWTYATDGRVCIRVPRQPEHVENEKAPDASRLFANMPASGFLPLPAFTFSDDGSDDDCPECDGRGTQHACPSCQCICDECEGSGKDLPIRRTSIGFRGAIYGARYISRMQSLPGLTVHGEPSKDDPLHFKFDGGEGVLMPRRVESATHIEIEHEPAVARAS